MKSALREEYFDLIEEHAELRFETRGHARWFGALSNIFHNSLRKTLFDPEEQFWWDISAQQFEEAIAFLKGEKHTHKSGTANTAVLMAKVLTAWNSKRAAWERDFGAAIEGILLSQIGQREASLTWYENLPKATPKELQNILDFLYNLTE